MDGQPESVNSEATKWLSSSQARYALLGFGIGLFLLLSGWLLVFRPALQERRQNREDSENMQLQIEQYRQLLEQAEPIERENRLVGEQLKKIMAEQMVPAQASLGWASIKLHSMATRYGLEIIERTGEFVSPQGAANRTEPFLLENFVVRFTMRGGYHQIGRFLALLETSIPFALLQDMSISRSRTAAPGQSSPDSLVVNITYRFPRFTEAGFPPEQRP